MRTFRAPDPASTFALGRTLGECAPPSTVIALIGDLGAGKTVFAKGIGAGLGVCDVRSPTFIIVRTHPGGRLPFWHADLYRLDHPEDLDQLGLDEILISDGVVVIEWADRFSSVLPADHLEVRLTEDEGGRLLEVRPHGPRHAALERLLG